MASKAIPASVEHQSAFQTTEFVVRHHRPEDLDTDALVFALADLLTVRVRWDQRLHLVSARGMNVCDPGPEQKT